MTRPFRRLSREAIARLSSDSAAKRATSEYFSVVYTKTDSADTSGCAVVVSKKVTKTSVGRHLLKRRIRAALKAWCHSSQAFIIYACSGSNSLPYDVLADELSNLLLRVGASRTM
jgi:ribonuclease P protein component